MIAIENCARKIISEETKSKKKVIQKDFIRSKLVKDCCKVLRKVGQFNVIQ